jgi:hypothetical protein
MRSTSRRNALILTRPSLITDHFVQAWLGAGNKIAAIWTVDGHGFRYSSERRLCAWAAGVTPTADHIRRMRIPVVRIERLTETPEVARLVDATGADTLVTLLSGVIVPKSILAKFGRQAVNLHPAFLPHYKGPAPRLGMLYDEQADSFGGIALHRLSEGIDEGEIIARRRLPWSQSRHFVAWDLAAARATADIVRNELTDYLDGQRDAQPQDPAAGNYRRADKHEFVVTDDKPLAIVKSLFARAPGFVFPYMPRRQGYREFYFVTDLAAVLGRPTGRPPVIGRFRIETDIDDARVRLVRKGLYHRTIGHPAARILASRLTGFSIGSAAD